MKKYILLLLLFPSIFAAAQNAPIDFEPEGFGADFTWATFEAPEGETDPTFSVVPNISIDGTNPSETVAKLEISYPTNAVWGSAGCETMHGSDVGPFAITPENKNISLQFYQVGFAAPVALKFATTDGAAFAEVVVQNTIADAWVTVEFDMSIWIDHTLPGILDQVIFFPSYGPRSTGHTVYFDNIIFPEEVNVNELPEFTFQTFPNPTIDGWTISSDGSIITLIEVYDVLGKKVTSLSPKSNQARINGDFYNTGTYYARVSTAEGEGTIRLIKK